MFHRLALRASQTHTVGILVIVTALFFHAVTGGHMLVASNLQNIVTANAHIVVLTIGMVLVVTINQLDVSVGSVAAFASMSAAVAIASWGVPWWGGMILGLCVGAGVGAIQGLFVSRLRIPALIVTIVGMLVLRGAVQWASQSLSLPVPREFTVLGAGYLPDWGRVVGVDAATLVFGAVVAAVVVAWRLVSHARRSRRLGIEAGARGVRIECAAVVVAAGVLVWLFGTGREGTSFPVPGVVIVVLVLVYEVVSKRTAFGRHVRAVGGNLRAAELSGVDVTRVQMLVMVNMGALAALAGLMFAGRSTAAGPQDGMGWELDAIVAVFIGGAAISGGRGSIMGAVMGAALMGVLVNGLLLVGVGSDRAQVVKGLVLLVAVTLDAVRRRGAEDEPRTRPLLTT
ncbi:sugar ABC transporter permease [Actinomyces sp. B33]|uniref:ABC transporter permease subunit n=1 Tax=Actinomyces sp. B33 TaxID=2942131 RepID=UPI00234059D0|nr:sugar ABC transporter permease [Actinomyces sp. B33]MDC4233894.1 sugar ABC transporter permease [Actinomyces sp. B33]